MSLVDPFLPEGTRLPEDDPVCPVCGDGIFYICGTAHCMSGVCRWPGQSLDDDKEPDEPEEVDNTGHGYEPQ